MTVILFPPFPRPPGEPLPAPPETAADHVRNALQMVLLAEVRNGALLIPPDEVLTELLSGAIVRLYRAVAELDRSDL